VKKYKLGDPGRNCKENIEEKWMAKGSRWRSLSEGCDTLGFFEADRRLILCGKKTHREKIERVASTKERREDRAASGSGIITDRYKRGERKCKGAQRRAAVSVRKERREDWQLSVRSSQTKRGKEISYL